MSTDADDAIQSTDSPKPSTDDKYVISETQLGIWKLFTVTQNGAQTGVWQEVWKAYPLVIRLIVEAYNVCPQLIYLHLFLACWDGIQLAVEMRIENALLSQIERTVFTGKGNIYTTVFAIGCKVLHCCIDSYAQWSKESFMHALKHRLNEHFHMKRMQANLMTDLPTSAETSEPDIKEDTPAASLHLIFSLLTTFFLSFSQILLLLALSRIKGAKVFFITLLVQAILARFSATVYWSLCLFGYIENHAYKRAQSLKLFANGSFRQDIISSNLGKWIIAEYKKALAAVGDTSTEDLISQYYQSKRRALISIARDVLGDFPAVYFAIIVAINPQHSAISIASIATLQSSGRTLIFSIRQMSFESEIIRKSLDSLRRMYAPPKPSVMKSGISCLTEKDDTGSKGMSLILKDVSFAYPVGGKKVNALKGLNLHIKAGQLVVVVGTNGSGKSTLIRILARLYDISSGEFLIEERPSTKYCVEDLHLATSLLSQDSTMYPLSLAENIGLGYPERSSDLEMIKEAASEGGAAEFIERLENGYETMLETFDNSFHLNLKGNREHPLWIMSNKITKKSDISGGQRQRVIAARTFMRFKSGKIRLVLVDEPTSALDADGELQLFQRLMSAREGKTMVFVTHRFGHLTKFADQIICLKDGTIVESGSHNGLMSAAGEYAKLYKIQAQAFSYEG